MTVDVGGPGHFWECGGVSHCMAAEDVASVDVDARVAMGGVVLEKAPGGEKERGSSLRTRPRDSRGGHFLRVRECDRWTRPHMQWSGVAVAVYEVAGGKAGGGRGLPPQIKPRDDCERRRLCRRGYAVRPWGVSHQAAGRACKRLRGSF